MIVNLKQLTSTDLDQILAIWLQDSIDAHDFASPSYWQNNFDDIKKALPSTRTTAVCLRKKCGRDMFLQVKAV